MKAYLIAALVLVLAAMMTAVGYFVGSAEEAIPRALCFGFLTLLIVGGIAYLVIHFRSINQLDIPKEELAENEVVWAKTAQSMVYYKSGNPLKFWESVGGKLFLTNRSLEFRAGAGQPGAYRLKIPLSDIRRAKPCKIFGFIPGALRIDRHDGSFEVFAFGAAFDVSREWADAIMDFCDDLENEEE